MNQTPFVSIATSAIVAFVAVLHVWFMVLEMHFWTKPLGLKAFRQTQESANSSRVLAMNQGLYNGFLAAGLFWGLLHPSPSTALQIQLFFFSCVFFAGVLGGWTVHRKIFLIQGLPALAGLLSIIAANGLS